MVEASPNPCWKELKRDSRTLEEFGRIFFEAVRHKITDGDDPDELVTLGIKVIKGAEKVSIEIDLQDDEELEEVIDLLMTMRAEGTDICPECTGTGRRDRAAEIRG